MLEDDTRPTRPVPPDGDRDDATSERPAGGEHARPEPAPWPPRTSDRAGGYGADAPTQAWRMPERSEPIADRPSPTNDRPAAAPWRAAAGEPQAPERPGSAASPEPPTVAMPRPTWQEPRRPADPGTGTGGFGGASRIPGPTPGSAPTVGAPTARTPAAETRAPTASTVATVATQPDRKPPVTVRRLRRGRLAVRKIDPWAIFKLSLVFYFCMMLIALLAVAVIFSALRAFGVIDNVERLLRDLDFYVTISGGVIFRWVFLLGLVGTVVASLVTMFMAFLYNLIADVVGGVELLVTERE